MRWFAIVTMLVVLVCGCAPNTEPIERAVNKVAENVIQPAVEKAAAELKERSGSLTGTGSLTNPGWVFEGYAIFGTGVVYKGIVRLEGTSAVLAGSTQADQGPDLEDQPVDEPALE